VKAKAQRRGKLPLDEAFHKLAPALGPHGAVELMNAALGDPKRARLWCNGKAVDPGFIRTHLVVRARLIAKRRWTAEIEATRALDRPVEAYTWAMDAKQIEALRLTIAEKPPRKGSRESREQELVKEVVGEIWPEGHEYVRTDAIMQRVGDELERRGLLVPKRDVFLRALDRRKG
jgi:hypothetical protein